MKLFLVVIIFFSVQLHAAIEVVDGVSRTQNEATSKKNLSSERILGIGGSVGGALGVGGLKMDIGIFENESIGLGFGGGAPFLAFSLEYKRVLSGKTFMPYLVGGFTHWESTGKNQDLKTTSPRYLRDSFLSQNDIDEGKVSENLFYPGFGIQFYQPSGALAGSSVLVEVLLLSDLIDFTFVPTGGFSYLYYF